MRENRKNKLDYIGSITNFIGQWHNYAMSWPTTLTTLATLVANRRCYRQNVYRSNRRLRSLRPKPDQELWWNTRHTSLCTLHSPQLHRDLTRFARFPCTAYPIPGFSLPTPTGFHFGTWPVVKTLEGNKFPIKQVSAVAAESSPVERTARPSDPRGTVAAKSEAYTHISLMLLMHGTNRRG